GDRLGTGLAPVGVEGDRLGQGGADVHSDVHAPRLRPHARRPERPLGSRGTGVRGCAIEPPQPPAGPGPAGCSAEPPREARNGGETTWETTPERGLNI